MKETVTIGREFGYLDHRTGIVHPDPPDGRAEEENPGRRGRLIVEEVDSDIPETPDPVPRNRSRSRARTVRE